MAHEDESIFASPPTQEVARHVQDYSRFTFLLKWGALVCLVVAFFVLLMIS